MEIIVLPYLAVSFAIAWAIFAPFCDLADLRQWSFSRVQIGDLLAMFCPLSLLLGIGAWVDAPPSLKRIVWLAILAMILMVAGGGLLSGLYLLAKMDSQSVLKRMLLIGFLIPAGVLLTFAWIMIPLAAYAHSALIAIPAAVAIIPTTLGLRKLACWIGSPSDASESR